MFGTQEGWGSHAQESSGGGAIAGTAEDERPSSTGPTAGGPDDDTMRFADGVTWRISQRGLLVCGPGGSPLLIEHARAADLPELLAGASCTDDLSALLGDTDADRQLIDDLVAEHILTGSFTPAAGPTQQTIKRVTFSRSGIEFTGIDTVARAVHRVAWPVLRSWPGRIVIATILIAGATSLILGRPDGPQVTQNPWVDATVGLVLGLALAGMHELAHAVTLIHYGRIPRAAGCGFYWGALCFYVDSSDGMTLPRRARIINALAGLAVDLVTACPPRSTR